MECRTSHLTRLIVIRTHQFVSMTHERKNCAKLEKKWSYFSSYFPPKMKFDPDNLA